MSALMAILFMRSAGTASWSSKVVMARKVILARIPYVLERLDVKFKEGAHQDLIPHAAEQLVWTTDVEPPSRMTELGRCWPMNTAATASVGLRTIPHADGIFSLTRKVSFVTPWRICDETLRQKAHVL